MGQIVSITERTIDEQVIFVNEPQVFHAIAKCNNRLRQ